MAGPIKGFCDNCMRSHDDMRNCPVTLRATIQDYRERYEHQYDNYVKASEDVDILEIEVKRLKAALQWCSGSADFGHGGQARIGWLRVCAPLLRACKC